MPCRHEPAAAESLLTRIGDLLAASGKNTKDPVHDEQERQVAANATRPQYHHKHAVRCPMWTEIFELVNLVDGTLADSCGFEIPHLQQLSTRHRRAWPLRGNVA